ncbi:VOC family protein [Pyxidicoccus parkwayensis]|uniref:VOC family protein n=1 Tax=Pyxidicoccus parkwayensis TaxID=2813578 RepID=A0ABX7NJL8_9BACT|nr:VOC family protein [Pyxidicoccus parkwaysis]QSQ19031.1 VOC family protein [Pyxidicoccus parkwaysis]
MRLPGSARARLHGGLLLLGVCALGGVVSAVAGCAATVTTGSTTGAVHAKSNAHLPLSPTPLYGKFVWHDLVTQNPAAVKRFYSQLLGWEFQDVKGSKRPYTLIKAEGLWIGGIVEPIGAVGKSEVSQWLGYLSVPDVDRAVQQVKAGGGKALVEPEDVQKIGRAAVVADPQGAPLGFVRAEHGDPADTGMPEPGQFLWMENLADDAASAVSFYKDLLGYEVEERNEGGGPYYVMKQSAHPRAGVFRKPVEKVRPNWLTYVRVEDPTALMGRVEELGGRVLMAPREDVRGGSLAIIADPSGAVLALQRYPFKTADSATSSQ